MKNKVKFLTILMAAALAACSSSTASSETEKDDTSSGETAQETVKEETDEVTFEQFTAIDNEACSIAITDIKPDALFGYTVKTLMENKSDKTLMFAAESASVNGVQCDPLFASEIAAGKKSNEDITFADSALKNNGIDRFTDIEIVFRVYDSEDWSADPVVYESVHVYPFGEDKAETFVRQPADSDTVLADNDDVSVIVTGYDPDNMWGYTVNMYILNKSDKRLMVSIEDASVNGFMADPFFATSVNPQRCEFTSVSWTDSALEENGISEVEEIEFSLIVHDYDDYMADPVVSQTVTLKP